MAAKDLITLARAYQELQGVSNQDALLGTLITACSEVIEKYCLRRFVSTAYDELYNGNGDRRLLLRQYPLQSVKSVRYRPVTVLKVQNTNTSSKFPIGVKPFLAAALCRAAKTQKGRRRC
jgi:hypothetical protein